MNVDHELSVEVSALQQLDMVVADDGAPVDLGRCAETCSRTCSSTCAWTYAAPNA